MKFSLLIHTLSGGGVERSTIRLARRLAELGHEVDLAVFSAEGSMVAEVPASVRLVDFRSRHIATTILPYVRYMWRERPDVVISANSGANLIASLLNGIFCPRCSVIITQRSREGILEGRQLRWRHRVLQTFCRIAYRRADAIVAISNGVAQRLFETVPGLRRERMHVIYNPVWSLQIAELATAPADHPWLGAEGQLPVVLGVGRLSEEKGFDTLIRAFGLLTRHREARLIIIGEGEERAKLERVVAETGLSASVSLPGYMANPFAAMARCAVFVLPSQHEGFGNVLVEAMACGASIVSTDCPGGPGEILAGGAFGTLVPVDDAPAMAQALAGVLDRRSDPARQVERAKVFSIEAAANRYLALARSLAPPPGPMSAGSPDGVS